MDLQELNETSSTFWLCTAQRNSALNRTGNLNVEITNTTCSNASVVPKLQPPRQKEVDALRILLYSLIFLLGVFGNLLIIAVLALNKRMRTVTNNFLLSLAVSDLMMALFCMPFTLIPNLLEDFVFGAAMCKTVGYFMGISVSISTFSLVAIAIERYSAICNPLKSRSWQTRSHAYKVIAVTWALAVVIMIPYPVFSSLVPFKKPDNSTAHMCRLDWPMSQVEQTWYMLLLFVLFFLPGVLMTVAYGLISRELYRGIQFELEQKNETTGVKNGLNGAALPGCDEGDGCYVQVPRKALQQQQHSSSSVELSALTTSGNGIGNAAKPERARSNTSETKLAAKKRVIRMLVIIVAVFFACWMPVYAANAWKAFDARAAHRALSGAPISFIHLLSYCSACVNPVIYCFMNTRFRQAALATFACGRGRAWSPCRRRRRGDGGEEEVATVTSGAMSASKFSYSTVSTVGPC